MGLTPVPPGHLATVVTSLEQRERPTFAAPLADSDGLAFGRWAAPAPAAYRALFLRVGAPWLWFSRLLLDDDELAAALARSEVYAPVTQDGERVGLVELTRDGPVCELVYFAWAPEWIGRGVGGWLMDRALRVAWTADTTRVWLHSCTLDHPAALLFYRRHGFRDFARAVEVFADPRLIDCVPRDAAPQVPLLSHSR